MLDVRLFSNAGVVKDVKKIGVVRKPANTKDGNNDKKRLYNLKIEGM